MITLQEERASTADRSGENHTGDPKSTAFLDCDFYVSLPTVHTVLTPG